MQLTNIQKKILLALLNSLFAISGLGLLGLTIGTLFQMSIEAGTFYIMQMIKSRKLFSKIANWFISRSIVVTPLTAVRILTKPVYVIETVGKTAGKQILALPPRVMTEGAAAEMLSRLLFLSPGFKAVFLAGEYFRLIHENKPIIAHETRDLISKWMAILIKKRPMLNQSLNPKFVQNRLQYLRKNYYFPQEVWFKFCNMLDNTYTDPF
jgi:hypothetical protein